MRSIAHPVRPIVAATVLWVLAIAPGANAQTMFFSESAMVSFDSGTVYGTMTYTDGSSGCYHYDYGAQAVLTYGGSSAYGSAGGLSADVSMSYIDDGDYTVSGDIAFFCDCVQTVLYAGGTQTATANITRFSAVLQYDHYNSLTGKHEYDQNSSVCNGSCQPPRYYTTVQASWVQITGYRAATPFATYCRYDNISTTNFQPQCTQNFGTYLGGFDDRC